MSLSNHKDRSDRGVLTASQRLQGDLRAWEGLLAHCVGIAKAAAAIPDSHEHAQAWQGSIEAIITLHSVTMALDQLGGLAAEERAVGMDRAGILIGEGARALSAAWGGQAMPEGLLELMSDARQSVERAQTLGVHWVVQAEGFEMGSIEAFLQGVRERAQGSIEVYAAQAGQQIKVGQPAAVVVGGDERRLKGLELAGCAMENDARAMVQVYHVPGKDDLVQEVSAGLPPGRPMLHPVL
ncbi:MAG: hypothetical protein AAGB34_11060 [Planctomycetota bacterium]